MRWLTRFLGWATVLAAPSWLIGDAYHHGLAKLSLWILRIPSERMAFEPPDIPASHALGVFGALCLASVRTPLARRLVALAIGVTCMAALELLTGVMAIRWSLGAAAAGGASAPAQRLLGHLTGLPAWIGAPVLWLLLLGGRELPRAPRSGRARSEPAART